MGVTVRRWFRRQADQLRYEEVLAAFVDWLIGDENAQVVFVPQVTYALGRRRRSRRGPAHRGSPAAARAAPTCVEAELRPGEIKGLCGQMTYFVGTRMHSNIFALSMGVPVLAIGYLPKTSGLMEQLGLGEWTVPIDSLELPCCRTRTAGSWLAARTSESDSASTIPELTRSALHNGRVIEERYLRWCATRADRGLDRRKATGT